MKHTRSINGRRQTHRDRQSVSVRRTGVCCAPLSRDNTQHDGGGGGDMKHTPAITCLRSYILLDIESFSQPAPKNKQSSVRPCRWAGARQPLKSSPLRTLGGWRSEESHFLLRWLWTVTVSVYMLLWLSARHSELPPPSFPSAAHLTFKQKGACKYLQRVVFRSPFTLIVWTFILCIIKTEDFSTHSCKWSVYWVKTC